MLLYTSVPEKLHARSQQSTVLGGTTIVHQPQVHFVDKVCNSLIGRDAACSQASLFEDLAQLLKKGYNASVLVVGHQQQDSVVSYSKSVLCSVVDRLSKLTKSVQLAVGCHLAYIGRTVDLFALSSTNVSNQAKHAFNSESNTITVVEVTGIQQIQTLFRVAAHSASSNSTISQPCWLVGDTSSSHHSDCKQKKPPLQAVIAQLWCQGTDNIANGKSSCLKVIDFTHCFATSTCCSVPITTCCSKASSPPKLFPVAAANVINRQCVQSSTPYTRAAEQLAAQWVTQFNKPDGKSLWSSLTALIHNIAAHIAREENRGVPLQCSTHNHPLLLEVARHIVGSTCCHWLVSGFVPNRTAAELSSCAGQPVIEQQLAGRCSQQHLRRVLQEARTIQTVCEPFSSGSGPWKGRQQPQLSLSGSSSNTTASNSISPVSRHAMLSFQEFVESRKGRPQTTGQLQRSTSARPSTVPQSLLALDDFKLHRSSTFKAYPDPAAAANLPAGSAHANIQQPCSAPTGGMRYQSEVSNVPTGQPGTVSAADMLHLSNSSSKAMLSRSSTVTSAHTTTTVTSNAVGRNSSQHQASRQASMAARVHAGAASVATNALGVIQPLSMTDALASPRAHQTTQASLAAPAPATVLGQNAAQAGSYAAPGVQTSGRRYAAAAAGAATPGVGSVSMASSRSSSLVQRTQLQPQCSFQRSNTGSSRRSTLAPLEPAKAVALHSLQQQQDQLQQMLRQVSQKSRPLTPSRLSIRTLPASDELLAMPCGAQPAADGEINAPANAPAEYGRSSNQEQIAAVVLPQQQQIQQTQDPVVQEQSGQQQSEQQRAALQNLQQQFASLQRSFRSAFSRRDSAADRSSEDITEATSAGHAAANMCGNSTTPGTSATPSPRDTQPQPYATGAVPCTSAADPTAQRSVQAGIQPSQKCSMQTSTATQSATAVCVEQQGNTRTLQAVGSSSIKTQATEMPSNSTFCPVVPPSHMDVTLDGHGGVTKASAVEADEQSYDATDCSPSSSDVSFEADGWASKTCDSGLLMEPSSTVSESDDGSPSFRNAPVKGCLMPHEHRLNSFQHKACKSEQAKVQHLGVENSTSSIKTKLSSPAKRTCKHLKQQHRHSLSNYDDSCCRSDVLCSDDSYSVSNGARHVQDKLQRGKGRHVTPDSPTSAMAVIGNGAGTDSHVVLVIRQHAKQLQQQNDALVRVLERERQEHQAAKQQAMDAQQQLAESRAEWEVKLQMLRQDKAAVNAQLRKVLAGGDHLDVMDAYDAALAASAAKVDEAQAAAAALAAQLADAELKLQQQAASHTDPDSALAAAATESLATRTGAQTSTKCSSAGPLAALRQHQKHLEQQLAKQQAEFTQLQRQNIKLLRYKKQFESVAQKLQQAAAGEAAAETAAHGAGLRAAAEYGKAERLQLQVDQLLQEKQQLQSARQGMEQQMHALQQQLHHLQQEMHVGVALGRASPVLGKLAGTGFSPGADAVGSTAAAAEAGAQVVQASSAPYARSCVTPSANCQQQAEQPGSVRGSLSVGNSKGARRSTGSQSATAVLAGTSSGLQLPAAGNMHTSTHIPAQSSDSSGRRQLKHSQSMLVDSGMVYELESKAAKRQLKHSRSAPVKAGKFTVEALALAQQVAEALPATDAQLNAQMSTLLTAIAAGGAERDALAAQSQMLLGMITGTPG